MNQPKILGLQNARFTLKILDIEHSLLVNDDCLPLLLKFSKLYSLAMSKTKLSTESQAEIIKDLPNICVLPRGDFLCDALGKLNHYQDKIEIENNFQRWLIGRLQTIHLLESATFGPLRSTTSIPQSKWSWLQSFVQTSKKCSLCFK